MNRIRLLVVVFTNGSSGLSFSSKILFSELDPIQSAHYFARSLSQYHSDLQIKDYGNGFSDHCIHFLVRAV